MGTEHEKVNTAGQTKWESDLWPSDWGPFASFFSKRLKQAEYDWYIIPQAAQAHYLWVRASEVIWSEYTRIISVLSDAK